MKWTTSFPRMQLKTSDNGQTKQRYLFSVILAGHEYSKCISSSNSSFPSLFLLFIMWCPIFNNKYNLANVRCCGNALYFFAMAIFSSRVPLFTSGFKKSVWIINEQVDSLTRAFKWRFSAVGWKFHRNISFQPGCSNSMYSYNPDRRCFVFVLDPAPNFILCEIYKEFFQLNTYSELEVELDYSNQKLKTLLCP